MESVPVEASDAEGVCEQHVFWARELKPHWPLGQEPLPGDTVPSSRYRLSSGKFALDRKPLVSKLCLASVFRSALAMSHAVLSDDARVSLDSLEHAASRAAAARSRADTVWVLA